MQEFLKILVKCPLCGTSLMNPTIMIDDLPAIVMEARTGSDRGRIYLSQIYGSYNKSFEGVEDIEGSIAEFSCPHCHEPFPHHEECECGAPMISLNLTSGGIIKVCTRNGCPGHSLEFVNADDAFLLFKGQDTSGLL
ncbi:MAG: hypothetical protein JXO48_02270 [Deltaproteobacteria bacterium]|nr:hypothetical protein [Deltaproteobacteria bacterium]